MFTPSLGFNLWRSLGGGKGESSAPEMNPKQSERVSLTPTARHLEVKRGPSFRREGLRVHQIRGSTLPSLYQTGEGFFLGFDCHRRCKFLLNTSAPE